MGDKIYENIDGLLVELLSTMLSQNELIDEVYCQIMKQVTENPKKDSEERGWNLMAIVLATCPPSAQLENYLEFFLRRSFYSTFLTKALHKILLCGPLTDVPSISELSQVRQSLTKDVWFNGQRSVITTSKESFEGAVIPDQIAIDWRSPGGDDAAAEEEVVEEEEEEDVDLGGGGMFGDDDGGY